MSRKRACPACGEPMIPIRYGYPDDTLIDAAARGEAVIGGCIIEPGQPHWSCPECGMTTP